MVKFKGKKWFVKEVELVKDKEVWWEDSYIEKPKFKMTRKYSEWCQARAEEKRQEEIRILKAKLEYQFQKYGQVDEIEFQYFLHLTSK